jgi:DNA-binding IclR family transcriptional regulator
VRALYPDRSAFVDRHGAGPTSLSALQSLLGETRQRGYAVEQGEVTPGFASVAAAVLDHHDHPAAGIAVTYPSEDPVDRDALVAATQHAAALVSRRIGGRPRG